MKNKKGLLALLGLGLGALAIWKYKTMPEDKKQELKSKVNEAGRKIKETAQTVEDTVKEKYSKTRS
jgi:hypothetical protein